MEKLIFFLLPGLFVLPELIAGKEGLSGVCRASAEILALISQTRKPSVNSSIAGSRGCLGDHLHSCVLAWPSEVSTCPRPRSSHITQLDWRFGENVPRAGRSVGQLDQSQQPSHRQPLQTSLPSLLQPPWCHRCHTHHPTIAALRAETWRKQLVLP